MNSKDLTIICMVIIAIVAFGAIFIALQSNDGVVEDNSNVSTEITSKDSEVAHEASSTSKEAGWPFDAPQGWHWIRTQPGETWLLKDDGTVEQLYVGEELYLENKLVNGKMEKSYDNGKDAAGVQVSVPTRYF